MDGRLLRTLILGVLPLWALACTYDGDPKVAATTKPTDASMKDPLGSWTHFDPNRRDISGGGINNYNRDAMKRDIDNTVFLK